MGPKMMRLMLAMLLFAVSTAVTGSANDNDYARLPLVRLLASPETHDLQPVLTAGYARNTVRGLFLFLTEGDARHRVYINGILIEIDRNRRDQEELGRRIDGQYVSVAGTFDWLGDGASVLRGATKAIVHSDVEREETGE